MNKQNEMARNKSKNGGSKPVFLFFIILISLFSLSVNAENPCGSNKIALLGDSITNDQGTKSWGNEFKKLCGNLPVNFAHSGKRTDWMLSRLKGEVDDSSPYTSGKILGQGYTHLIVLGGTNDITAGWDTITTISNLEQIYSIAKQNDISVIAGTITPYNVASYPEGNEKVKEINEWIKSQYQLGNIDGVIDFYSLLLGTEPCMDPGYKSSCDNVHPNSVGYQAMANKAITELFGGQAGYDSVVQSATTIANLQEFTTMMILGRHIRSEMEDRVKGGLELIKQGGNFNKLILTGGCVPKTNGDATCVTCSGSCNEADEMKKYLLKLDPNFESRNIQIIEEGDSSSTGDNYKKSKGFIQSGEKVLVVSDHNHVRSVAYCLRYSDPGADAYYYHLKEISSGLQLPATTIPGTDQDHYGLAKGCEVNYPSNQQPSQPVTNNQNNPSPGQQYTTSLVPKNLPSQQREIDQSWNVKIGHTVRDSVLIWDDTLGAWDWRNYTDVYFSVVSTPVSNKIVMGKGSAAVGSYSDIKYSKGGDGFNSLITEAAQNLGIEKEFIKAIMKAESNFKIGSISASNYVGLMQIRAGSKDQYIKVQCNQKPASTGKKLCDISKPKDGGNLYPVCTSAGGNCQEDDRFDPKKNIYSGTQHLIDKITSLGFNKNSLTECQRKATIAAYNIGQTYIRNAVGNVGCNNWETVWNDLNANAIISPDGTCTIYNSNSKDYPHNGKPDCRHKLDNLKNTNSYLSNIYGAYLGYKAAGLGASGSPSGPSATTSSSTEPYQGTYAGQAQVKDPNCLILYGDTRNPKLRQKTALESIKKECDNPSLFHVGDFVDEGESTKAWEGFLDYERDLINQGTLYAIVGNHEDRKTYAGKGYQAIADHLGDEFPYILSQMSNGGHHVVPITPNLIAIILNTEGNCNAETQFLEQQLNANPNKNIMLGFHKPAYPHIHTTHGNGCAKKWHKLLVEHKSKGNKVLAFAGDTHGLARVIRDGVTHLEVGAMLNPRSCLSPQGGEFCLQTRGYYRCDANLHCVAKDENGKTLDEFNV
jgi:lysophospholipase L1-like esterase